MPDGDPQFEQRPTLFLGDLGTGLVLLNHARRVVIERISGVVGQDANLISLIAMMLLAQSVRDRFRKMASSASPGGPDTILGLAYAREAVFSVAGPSSRDMPMVAPLILLAVVGAKARPVIGGSLHDIKSASHRMAGGFHHRYGYLVDPGHLRSRRAVRRAKRELSARD